MNQFLLNTAVLLLSGEVCQRTGLRMFARALAASAVGATLGVLSLTAFRSYYAYLALTYILFLPLMTQLGFCREPPRLRLRHMGCCFATALLLGGLVAALENSAGIASIPFLSTFCGFLIARFMIREFLRKRKIGRLLVPVTIEHRGRHVESLGLIDTGNLLREPYTGKPVHIISPPIMEKLGIDMDNYLGLAPCRTINSSEDLLEIYRIDNLSIIYNRKPCSIPNAVIAKASAELFINKEYQLILNSDCRNSDCLSSDSLENDALSS